MRIQFTRGVEEVALHESDADDQPSVIERQIRRPMTGTTLYRNSSDRRIDCVEWGAPRAVRSRLAEISAAEHRTYPPFVHLARSLCGDENGVLSRARHVPGEAEGIKIQLCFAIQRLRGHTLQNQATETAMTWHANLGARFF